MPSLRGSHGQPLQLEARMKALVILMMIVSIFVGAYEIYIHEVAHSEIYRHEGIDSDIEMFSLTHPFSAWTTPEKPCNESCRLANNINEVVGYNLQGLYIILGIGFLIIIIFMYFQNRNLEDIYEAIKLKGGN